MEGLTSQIIAAGVGGGIVALIGLVGVLFRIFTRLGRMEKSGEVLEKATEGLDAGLKATQDNVNKTRLGLQGDIYETRQGLQADLNESRKEFRDGLDQARQEFRDDMNEFRKGVRADLQRTEDRLRQEFREELRNTEERLRDQIRAESEATREATRNEIRRLTDAFAVHSHEANGTIIYRIPPQYTEPRPDGAGE